MPIKCKSPECEYRHKIPDELAGESVPCPKCETRFKTAGKLPARKHREQVEAGSIIACCPHCGKRGTVPEKAAGRQAKCPGCGAILAVPEHPGPAPDKRSEDLIEANVGTAQKACDNAARTPIMAQPASLIGARTPIMAQPASLIDFLCPTCKTGLRAAPEHAGAEVDCPKCSQRIQIPEPIKTTNKTVLGLVTEGTNAQATAVEAIVDPTIDHFGRRVFNCPYCHSSYPPYFKNQLSTGGIVAVILIFLLVLPGAIWSFLVHPCAGSVSLVVFLLILFVPFAVWRETHQYCAGCGIRISR
jgi:hypothetical protein